MTDQLTPDAAQIRLHLEILFSDLDALGPYPNGLFELRFLPHNGGTPTCKLFGWGDIDKAVEIAVRANANGMNGYVGVHPRKPGTSRAGQASDVERACWQFVDCDNGEASAKLLELPFSPNFIVTTGTRPTQRLHGYYMLEAPETDMAAYTARQAALAAAVGGDNVKDAPRIMRLAGTVSHPSKDKAARGYVPELVTISDVDPIPYAAEELDPFLAQFKATAEPQLLAATNMSIALPTEAPKVPTTVEQLLQQSRGVGQWHNSMRDATWRLVQRGFGEQLIAEICGPYCTHGASDPELQNLIRSAMDKCIGAPGQQPASDSVIANWGAGLETYENGRPRSHVANIIWALENCPELAGAFQWNEMTSDIEIMSDLPWTNKRGSMLDHDQVELQAYLNAFGFNPTVQRVQDALGVVARRRGFHPIKEYFDQLVWDGISRLQSGLLDALQVAHTDFSRAVAMRFMIAAVARIMQPGAKVDTMLVLEGRQGAGKSTAASILAEIDGRSYFLETLEAIDQGKAAREQLVGKMIVEVQEMDAIKGKERTKLKAWISTRTDNFRSAYARVPEDRGRTCVFIGTTNDDQWLTDPSGGRRFWPLRVEGQIDTDWLRQNVDQIWAEAFVRFAEGEQWYLTKSEEAFARVEQEDRRKQDGWEDAVIDFIARHKLTRVGMKYLYDELSVAANVTQKNAYTEARIADVFQALPGDWKKMKGRQRAKDPVAPDRSGVMVCWEPCDPKILREIRDGNFCGFNE